MTSNGTPGGYEANFNPSLEDKHKCPVCLVALRDPVQTRCGHRICATCYNAIRGNDLDFRCPIDNTWSNQVFDDNAAKREVLSLSVDCSNRARDCEWSGELRDLQKHVQICDYVLTPCPNDCKASGSLVRRHLDSHLLECPLRVELCAHCGERVVASQLAHHHLLICPRCPVNCPECGTAEIARADVAAHLSRDCPMMGVACSFAHLGCTHMDARQYMSRHCIESSSEHLLLVMARLQEAERRHRAELAQSETRWSRQLLELSESLRRPAVECFSSSMCFFNWTIQLDGKRKAHFSPSQALPSLHTVYRVHFWLKPETNVDGEMYTTVALVLEGCEGGVQQLPVVFECQFECNEAKAQVVTDGFAVSGHASRPMILFKTSEMLAEAAVDAQVTLAVRFNVRK